MKTYPMRARIRNEGQGPARIEIFDDIGSGFFSDGVTPASFASQLQGVKGPLDVHVSSSGGDVFDGLAIADAIRSYAGPVTTYVDGLAASIASVIVQAGRRRVMAPGSMLMIHDALAGAAGNEAELLKMAQTLGKVSDNLADVYAARAGGTPEQWRDAMKAETWYTADEAVAAGLADEVGGQDASLPQGVDVDALAASAPGRIMAVLRSMPRAAAGDGQGDGGTGGKKCKTCNGKGRLKHPVTGAKGVNCPSCKGTGRFDPDRDGDDDSTAGGDTDHDYVLPDGSKAKPAALTEERVRAILREEVAVAAARLRNGPLPVHHTATDDKPFDGSHLETYVQGSPAHVEAAMREYAAWVDPGKDATTKAAYKLGHHDISPDGKVGDANLNGVRAGLAELGGARGGVGIPAADKAGVRAHLEAHLKDGGGHPAGDDGKNAHGKSDFAVRLEQLRGALPPLGGAGE